MVEELCTDGNRTFKIRCRKLKKNKSYMKVFTLACTLPISKHCLTCAGQLAYTKVACSIWRLQDLKERYILNKFIFKKQKANKKLAPCGWGDCSAVKKSLAKDMGLISSSNLTAYNHFQLIRLYNSLFWLLHALYTRYIYIYTWRYTHAYKTTKINLKNWVNEQNNNKKNQHL